jgi:hypothetical protein
MSRSNTSRRDHLVRRFHIRDAGAIEEVGQDRQRAIGDRVDRQLARPEEPRPVHHRRAAVQDGFEEPRMLRRIDLQVSVLNHDDVAGRRLHAARDRGALARVACHVDDDQLRIEVPDVADAVGRAIRRSVVDDDDFARDRQGDRVHARENGRNRRRFVVSGDDDRQPGQARWLNHGAE